MRRSRSTMATGMKVLAAAAMLAGVGAAAEWPRFRGPEGAGVAEGADPPVKWTAADYLWKTALPGRGHSSPVLWGERLFVTSAEGNPPVRHVLCLSVRDGSVLWSRRYPVTPFHLHGDNSYAAASPAVDGQRVYVLMAAADRSPLVALDHDGREIWTVDAGPYRSQHGPGSSPVVWGELVIVAHEHDEADSFVMAVDRQTGRLRWKLPRRSMKHSASTPAIYQPADGPAQVVLASRAHGIYGVDAASGKLLWEVSDLMPQRTVSSPVVAGDLVVATCGEGGVGRAMAVVRPPQRDGQKPEVVWKTTTDVPYVPTPVGKDGRLYLWRDNGMVLCVEAASGRRIWEGRVNAPFYGSPVWAAGRLYCISRRGEVFVVSAGDRFEVLAQNDLGEPSFATPAVAGTRLYLRTVSHVICVGRR